MDSASAPHDEHSFELGKNLPIFVKVRPYSLALYSSIATKVPHPASCTLLANRVRASPLIARPSTYTAWFSRTIMVEVW
ncbi:hypothetical protein H4W81_004608 [Nonomuraea africana]|uniref:Uncharacterized protein n=1 Tax=Nonomuraea africana TaxID=46171 RepID=A0ABR9KIH6_9ACTN|nr:hypothetical protein [Nonomuraea africana]